jgi:hypothetical protein
MKRMTYKEKRAFCNQIKAVTKSVDNWAQMKVFWHLLSKTVIREGGLAFYWLRDEAFKVLNAETDRRKKHKSISLQHGKGKEREAQKRTSRKIRA